MPDTPAGDHGDLHVKVVATNEPDPRPFDFPHQEHVGTAAEDAAHEFGLKPSAPSFQTKDGTVLPRDISLAAAHVHSGDTLELVDAGGGV